jgi:hypothetical protein
MKIQLAEALALVPEDFVFEWKHTLFNFELKSLSYISNDSTRSCLINRQSDSSAFCISFNRFRGDPKSGGRFYVHDRHHAEGPATIHWYESGQKRSECYYWNGKIHRPRLEGPAQTIWNEDGSIYCVEYWENGKQWSV